MSTEQLERYLFVVGVSMQLGGAVLLAALFVLLRRHAERRAYFAMWTRAWVVLSVALIAVLLGMLPALNGHEPLPADSAPRLALRFAYQCSKFLYAALLVLGTRMYAVGNQPRRAFAWVAGASASLAGIDALLALRDVPTTAIQAPVLIAALGYCAATLLQLPASRRSTGSRATGLFFASVAAAWACYFLAYEGRWHAWAPTIGRTLLSIVSFNPYIDSLLQMMLACGMIVMLMEDAKREADDAHAELAVAHDKLRRDALYDPLTGSLNRRAFEEGVGLERARATFGAVVVLDMDNLKQVNDGAGHAAGDELLQHLASTLHGVIRPSDRLYRWGGDEFLVVFPGARSADIQQRVEEAILVAPPLQIAGIALPVAARASVGSADYSSGEKLLAAIERADGVMYRAKKTKRAKSRGEQTPAISHEKFIARVS